MSTYNETKGVAVAKGIRSCSTLCFVPVVAVCLGILIGQHYGALVGILGGIASLFIVGKILASLIDVSTKELTIIDCLMPSIVATICGIIFFPISLFSGSLFSIGTCIFAGILFTLSLFMYRTGKIGSGYLILPCLTFLYEILPIELPTDLDNFLSLGGSFVSTVKSYVALKDYKEDERSALLSERETKFLQQSEASETDE